jgi:dTDP-4-dehydrorhamnose reductase
LTGACGQVGTELVPHLRSLFGVEAVVATDVRTPSEHLLKSGPFQHLDVTQLSALEQIIVDEGIGTIVHLAALLSATGEKNPQLALQVSDAEVEPDAFAPLITKGVLVLSSLRPICGSNK